MWKIIRAFSLEYCNLPMMVRNINVFMRSLMLNIDDREKKPIPLVFYILTVALVACYVYAYLISMVWFVLWARADNLAAMMVFMSLGVSSEIPIFKLLYMLVYEKRLQRLVANFLVSDARTSGDSRFSRNTLKALRTVKRRAIFYWALMMIDCVVYLVAPVFRPGRHLPEDFVVFIGLEPRFETPNYQLAYITTVLSVLFIAYVASNVASFTIIIAGYIEAQMLSLSEEILNIWEDSSQKYYKYIDQKIEYIYDVSDSKPVLEDEAQIKINIDIKVRLVQIVEIHSRNVLLMRQLDKFMSIPTAISFACLGVSLIAELLGGLENTYLQVPFTFVQVAMDCYTAQKVMDAGMIFERAVYACKWENFDKDNMKVVLLMLRNAQKKLTMSAGGMMMLSFSCLMSIVRFVYSAYTTLRSLM